VPLLLVTVWFALFSEPPSGQIIGHLDTGSNHHG